MKFPFLALACAAGLLVGMAGVQAQDAAVKVGNPWVRATVAGQKATGAFMTLTAKDGARVVGASSPVAGVTEIHEMAMEGNVMKMRAIPQLDLPAGKVVELKPGSYHVMLMDLKAPVKDGEKTPITLVVEGRDGKRQNVEVQAPVKAMGAAPAAQRSHAHQH